MVTYVPRTYYDPVPDAHDLGVGYSELKTSYKGFPITKPSQSHLFSIEPREGCDLPNMLAGNFTKMETLKRQIDRYLAKFPEATADTAYIQREVKRGPGRPPNPPAHHQLPVRKEPVAAMYEMKPVLTNE